MDIRVGTGCGGVHDNYCLNISASATSLNLQHPCICNIPGCNIPASPTCFVFLYLLALKANFIYLSYAYVIHKNTGILWLL